MTSRLKEDEKHERAIRALLRLEPNRTCINCNSFGPQYVCTNFWTFVCTNCSGIHREFNHRVKSVSMANFTSQEVIALQEGGNQHARSVYFKEWDGQQHSFPDSYNFNRLRDFIKQVYVDRRFTGDSASDKRVKNGDDKDESYENRRVEAYQGGSSSSPYEDSHERRYSDRSSPGGRNPGYDQESRQVGDYKRSPGHPPVINDWHREDRRKSDGDYKTESKSPVQARNLGSSGAPVGRPVGEILGENVVPLRICGPPKQKNGKAANASALTQSTASSGSLVSSNESQVNIKLETTKNLIDFDADPIASTIPQVQQTSAPQPVLQPGNSSDENWASFDIASETKANQNTSNLNPLESVLSQLSYSASLSSQASGVQGPIPAGALSFGSLSSFPSNAASIPSSGQWASSQHKQPMFSSVNSQPIPSFSKPSRSTNPFDVGSKQTPDQDPSFLSISSLHSAMPSVSPSLPMHPPCQSNPLLAWSPPLPNLGTRHSSSRGLQPDAWNPPLPSFQVAPPNVPSSGTLDPSSRGLQPDAWNPPLPPFQAAPPNVPSSGTLDPSRQGNASHAWNPTPPSPYASFLPPQAPTHASASGTGSYNGQQVPTNTPLPRQEAENFRAERDILGLSNSDQQPAGKPSTTPTSDPFPKGGNPFA